MAYLTSGKKKLLGSNTEGKGIDFWQQNTEYKVNDLCLYKETNYYSLYICTTEHTSVDTFVSAYWETIDGTEFKGYTKEEIEAMTDLILDTEVRIDKTYSSSKIYTDIQQCLEDSKTYTLEEIARVSTASYKVVNDVVDMTEEKYLYLLYDGTTNYDIYIVETDGTPTKIGNTQIDLSNYYTKTEIDNDFLKKVDADGKYATITTVDGKVDKDKIVTVLDDTVTDEQVASAKAVYDKLSDLPTDSGSKCYTTLNELGLTADATVEDVVNALKNGESFLAPVNTFTNYETIFPNKLPNDQWNKIHIIKGTSLASSHIRCFSQSGTCEYLANVNNTNVVSWNDVSGTYIDISDSTIEKLGNEILKYPVGKYRINSTATGNKFTDLPSNTEAKCGLIEINGTAVNKSPFTDTWVYRMYKFECLTGTTSYVRRLNSGATVGQIEADTGWQKDGHKIYTALSQLGLTAPVTVGEIFNVMADETMLVLACEGNEGNTVNELVHVSDVPTSFGVLTIKKGTANRFSIEYQNSLGGSPCNVKRWIGTLKGNDGTGLYWKLVSTQSTYVALSDMGLTADATIQDVIDKVQVGETALLRTDAFTNWSTLFNGIQWGYLKVEKTINGLSNIELQEVILPNRRYFGSQSNGKFSSWQNMQAIGNGGSSDVYSTSEQAIGTWVDGKTIYRKTIVKDSHSANAQLISGVDTFIRGYGTCERAGYVYNVPHCGLLAGHLQDEDIPYLNFKLDTSGALSTIGSGTYTISKLKVTLEYTKK